MHDQNRGLGASPGGLMPSAQGVPGLAPRPLFGADFRAKLRPYDDPRTDA